LLESPQVDALDEALFRRAIKGVDQVEERLEDVLHRVQLEVDFFVPKIERDIEQCRVGPRQDERVRGPIMATANGDAPRQLGESNAGDTSRKRIVRGTNRRDSIPSLRDDGLRATKAGRQRQDLSLERLLRCFPRISPHRATPAIDLLTTIADTDEST